MKPIKAIYNKLVIEESYQWQCSECGEQIKSYYSACKIHPAAEVIKVTINPAVFESEYVTIYGFVGEGELDDGGGEISTYAICEAEDGHLFTVPLHRMYQKDCEPWNLVVSK
jgi:hypothetical protein